MSKDYISHEHHWGGYESVGESCHVHPAVHVSTFNVKEPGVN